MNIQFKKIREYILVVLGVILAVIAVWASVSIIIFLTGILNNTLTFQQKNIRASEFDTAGFEKLNLMQEQRLSPRQTSPRQIVTPPPGSPTSSAQNTPVR